jgi:hypothetical protein
MECHFFGHNTLPTVHTLPLYGYQQAVILIYHISENGFKGYSLTTISKLKTQSDRQAFVSFMSSSSWVY